LASLSFEVSASEENTIAQKFISMRNLKFLVYEVFDLESLTRQDYFKAHNKKMFDLAVRLLENDPVTLEMETVFFND